GGGGSGGAGGAGGGGAGGASLAIVCLDTDVVTVDSSLATGLAGHGGGSPVHPGLDGTAVATWGCAPGCGDRIVQPELGETCDGGEGCRADCRLLVCGDGVLDP